MRIKRKQIESTVDDRDYRLGFRAFTDAIHNLSGGDGFAPAVSGTGAAVAQRGATWAGGNEIGILQLQQGTTATGRSAFSSIVAGAGVMLLGRGRTTYKAAVQFPVLSNATIRHVVRAGYLNSVSAEPANGVFFRYSDTLNGGAFQCVSRDNNTETTVNTGVVVAVTTTYNLRIEVNAAGTQAQFFINGALAGTITTNIPILAARPVGYGIAAIRSVGTTAATAVEFDYQEMIVNLTAQRT